MPSRRSGTRRRNIQELAIEVSFTQKRKDLARLADNYILRPDGNIRAVMGLDIEHKRSKEATLSVRRPHFEIHEAGMKELVAQQSVTNQVYVT